MKREDVENLEKATALLDGLHRELSLLAKKSSNDGLNLFKLRTLNSALAFANTILPTAYNPLKDFKQFDINDVPSNSDATMVLTAYLEELERYRADHITQVVGGRWEYTVIDGTRIKTAPPKKIGI